MSVDLPIAVEDLARAGVGMVGDLTDDRWPAVIAHERGVHRHTKHISGCAPGARDETLGLYYNALGFHFVTDGACDMQRARWCFEQARVCGFSHARTGLALCLLCGDDDDPQLVFSLLTNTASSGCVLGKVLLALLFLMGFKPAAVMTKVMVRGHLLDAVSSGSKSARIILNQPWVWARLASGRGSRKGPKGL